MQEIFIEKSYMTRRTKKNPQCEKITQLVPKFDWATFLRLPNAACFAAKFYDQFTTQMMREIHENKNGTNLSHLSSMENVIARAVMFTAEDIEKWCDERDWSSKGVTSDKVRNIKKYLSELGMHKGGAGAEQNIPFKVRKTLAERVMLVAEREDPLAEWLFTRLTANTAEDNPEDEI